MAALNVYGVGVVVADPDMRYVGTDGLPLCTMKLAFNKNTKVGNEWREETCYIRAEAWGRRAEWLGENLKKGDPLYVNGYFKQNDWESDGKKMVSFSISIQDFNVCAKKSKKITQKDNNNNNNERNIDKPQAEATTNDDMPF